MNRRTFLALPLATLAQAPPRDPWVPTPYAEVERILDAVQLQVGERHLELGSGDGRICAAAARRRARSVGVEFDHGRVLASQRPGYTIVEADFWTMDWSTFDILTTGDISDDLRPLVLERFRITAKNGARLALGHALLTVRGLEVFVQTDETRLRR